MLNRVSRVYIGEKSDEFKVTNITSVPTHTLFHRGYNRGALFNFLHKTLDFITNTCKVEKGVYRFHCTPFLPVIVQKMDVPIESVIPSWYVHGECPGR
uniref:Uncharacterized protein n=1 Tax=Tetranychus urticae TaxID=32264 RepID=T1KFE8_TETUR